MKRAVALGLISGLAALASGERSAGAQDRTTLRVGATLADDDTAFIYALRNNLYEKADLDIQLAVTMNGGATTAAVIGGALDIGKSSLIPALVAHTKGIPLVMVAPGAMYNGKSPHALLVQPVDTDLRTGKDLEGKTVGVADLGDNATLVISMWVDKNGGDSSNVRFVEIPNSALGAALQQHRVYAGIMQNPQLTEAIDAHQVKPLAPAMSVIAPQYMSGVWLAMRDWATRNVAAVTAFARVTEQAAIYTNSHHDATVAMISELTKIPIEVVRKMNRVDTYTSLDPAAIQPSITFAAKYKQIPSAFPAKDVIFGR